MRALVVVFSLCAGCASRSTLDATRADASGVDVVVDAPPETWSRETSGSACMERPTTCPVDDWGPLRTVQAVYEECTVATGRACGDLRLVFDAEGCLRAIEDISFYSPAFVDCVARVANAKRWQCAGGGAAYHMFQSCEL